MFANSPLRPEDFESLLPYGLIVGAHVTPIDHMYFSPADWSLGRDAYEVRAIQDGLIYALQPRDINVDANTAGEREWRMDIAHSCTFASYFDLITSLSPELEAIWAKWGAVPPDGIPIQAGQLVGWIGGQTLDFGVYDWEVVLPGFINPSRYDGEPWKIHTVDPFPYFPDDIREALLAKMERQVEPRAGKIDHDIDGRLVGNWFQQGTGGYQDPGDTWNYWDGHLAFVPDAIDPSVWWFSIGNYDGEADQFPLRGDQPDPRDVSVNSGPITYVLTHPYNPGEEVGVVLVEMTADRIVNLEVFADQTVPEVAGFTDAMRIYER